MCEVWGRTLTGGVLNFGGGCVCGGGEGHIVSCCGERQALTRRVLTGVQVRGCGDSLRNETRAKDCALEFLTFPHTYPDPRETQLLTHSDFESPNQLDSLQLRPDLD